MFGLGLRGEVLGQLIAVPAHHGAAGDVVGIGHIAGVVHIGHAGKVLLREAKISRNAGEQRLDTLAGSGNVHAVAVLADAAGQRVDDLVVRADDHAHVLGQAKRLRDLRPQKAHRRARGADVGQLVERHARGFEQFARPFALLHIVKQCPAGQRDVRHHRAGEPVAHVGGDGQEFPHRPLRRAQRVEHLRQRIGGIREDAGHAHERFLAHAAHQFVKFARFAVGKVHDDVGQRRAMLVDGHERFAERRNGDRRHRVARRQCLHAIADDADDRIRKHLRLQIGLARRVRIFDIAQRQLRAVVVKGDALRARAADVYAQTDHVHPSNQSIWITS